MISGISHEPGYLLAAGIAILLVTATLAGLILKRRAANGALAPAIDNLNARVHSWWIIAGAYALALSFGPAGVVLLFACVSVVALREFCAHTSAPFDRILHAAACWVALPLQYAFVWLQWQALFVFFLPLFALALRLSRTALPAGPQVKSTTGLLLCVYAISYIPALLSLEIPDYEGRNLFLVTFLVLITQLSDVLQYLWGKLAGRRAIAPRISPRKTVEGTLGGIASASLVGALLAPITPFSGGEAGTISLAVATLGFCGGLTLSAIKRSRGIKDWSDLIPGHGGILDRLDSLVLSAPFFFYVVYFGWAR